MTESASPLDCIVLAGDRRSNDPLAVSAGVAGKALVPVAGKAMLTHVLTTLAGWERSAQIILVAPKSDEYTRLATACLAKTGKPFLMVESAASLVDSVRSGLVRCQTERCFLLTADHVLLTSAWLEALLAAGARNGSALALGLADWHSVMARFPGSRRTRYRFSDCSVCGTNLFLLNDRTGVARILALWQQAEQQRKKPWRIVSLLGWGNLSRYLAGRLSLTGAFSALSARVGAEIRPMLIDDPLAAVDVDSAEDLALVEGVLKERDIARC